MKWGPTQMLHPTTEFVPRSVSRFLFLSYLPSEFHLSFSSAICVCQKKTLNKPSPFLIFCSSFHFKMNRKHTIVLVQPTRNRTSRTFSDYETVAKAMDGIAHVSPAQSSVSLDFGFIPWRDLIVPSHFFPGKAFFPMSNSACMHTR